MSAPMNWRVHAACAGKWDVFEPIEYAPKTHERRLAEEERTRQARAICAVCPVLLPCREWALTIRIGGIVGGLSEWERREMQKERAS